MPEQNSRPVITYVIDEQMQRHETRKKIIASLEAELGRTVVTIL